MGYTANAAVQVIAGSGVAPRVLLVIEPQRWQEPPSCSLLLHPLISIQCRP